MYHPFTASFIITLLTYTHPVLLSVFVFCTNIIGISHTSTLGINKRPIMIKLKISLYFICLLTLQERQKYRGFRSSSNCNCEPCLWFHSWRQIQSWWRSMILCKHPPPLRSSFHFRNWLLRSFPLGLQLSVSAWFFHQTRSQNLIMISNLFDTINQIFLEGFLCVRLYSTHRDMAVKMADTVHVHKELTLYGRQTDNVQQQIK